MQEEGTAILLSHCRAADERYRYLAHACYATLLQRISVRFKYVSEDLTPAIVREVVSPLKRRIISTKLQDATLHKTTIFNDKTGRSRYTYHVIDFCIVRRVVVCRRSVGVGAVMICNWYFTYLPGYRPRERAVAVAVLPWCAAREQHQCSQYLKPKGHCTRLTKCTDNSAKSLCLLATFISWHSADFLSRTAYVTTSVWSLWGTMVMMKSCLKVIMNFKHVQSYIHFDL